MLILPKPKFAQKWNINLINCPEYWHVLIENALCWTIAQKLPLRDTFLSLTVRFVSKKFWDKFYLESQQEKTKFDSQMPNKHNHIFYIDSSDSIKIDNAGKVKFLGQIICCTAQIYQEFGDINFNKKKYINAKIEENLIRLFIEVGLTIINTKPKDYMPRYRKALSKFGLY